MGGHQGKPKQHFNMSFQIDTQVDFTKNNTVLSTERPMLALYSKSPEVLQIKKVHSLQHLNGST